MNSFREFFAILMAMLLFVEPMRAQQTQVESDRVRVLREASDKAKADLERATQQELLGKKIQEGTGTSEPPKSPKPMEGTPEPKPAAAIDSQERQVVLPAVCSGEELGRIFQAIEQEKLKRQGDKAKLDEFFKGVKQATSCEDMVRYLQGFVDMNSLRGFDLKMGPDSKAIITDRSDSRLASYGISFNRRFSKWSQQRVAKKELRDLADYQANRNVLLDHLKYFQVPSNNPTIRSMSEGDRARLEQTVVKMREEAPGELNACLDEPWRWSPDVKLCRWVDAADVPVWVTTWAEKTLWGLIYDLEKKRDARMLVVWLPKAQEYMFWAGPCGGNGGWLPSGPAVVFRTDTFRHFVECNLLEAPNSERTAGGIILKPAGQLLRIIEKPAPADLLLEEEKRRKEGNFFPIPRIANWVWKKNGQVIQGTENKTEIMVTEPGNYSVENAGAQGPAQRCSVNLITPPPPPMAPEIICLSLTATVVGDRVEVSVPTKGDASLIRRMEIRLDGKAIPDSELRRQNGRYSFDYKLVPQDGQNHVVTAALERSDGSFQECTDKTSGNTIPGRPIVCPECTATASRTKGIRDGQQDILLRANIKNPGSLPVRNFKWTMRHPGVKDPVLLSEQEGFHLGIDKMPHDSAGKLISGTWIAVFSGEYQKPDGQWVKFSCPVELSVSKKGWNKGWLALLGLAVIPLLLSLGKKSRDPISQPGSIKPGTPTPGPSSIGNGVVIGIPIRIGANR